MVDRPPDQPISELAPRGRVTVHVNEDSWIRKQTKLELRAMTQDAVAEFTMMRRERLLPALRQEHPEWSEERVQQELDDLQPLYGEWDPVVQLGIVAADHRNSPELRKAAMAEQAQYLRPKLKSIEMTASADTQEMREMKAALASRLVGLLGAAASAKRELDLSGAEYRDAASGQQEAQEGAPGPGSSSGDDG